MSDKNLLESSKEVISELKKEHPELKQIPPEGQAIVGKIVAQFSAGPLPPATELAKYKQIDSSIPGRLLTLVEKEQEARHAWNENEAKCKQKDLDNIRLGQKIGCFLVLFLAICGILALFLHESAAASVIFGTTILSLFSARIFTNSKK